MLWGNLWADVSFARVIKSFDAARPVSVDAALFCHASLSHLDNINMRSLSALGEWPINSTQGPCRCGSCSFHPKLINFY